MSAIGSVIIVVRVPYQLAFFTPGITPSFARFLKQMRQIPNLRYTARGRPHNRQRRTSRVENFGFRFAIAIFDLLAIECPVLLVVPPPPVGAGLSH
jgi:hypothetical protein